MVVVKIWGGLGNQLFQYAFGKFLSAKLNTQVKFDIRTSLQSSLFIQRDFGLGGLNTRVETASPAELNKLKYFSNLTLARFERKAAQTFPYFFKTHFVEPGNYKSVEAMSFRDNCYYEGYWQSYKYLSSNEPLLRQEITFKTGVPAEITGSLSQIGSSVSVSIHIRRSDYLTLDHLVVCGMEYYNRAILYFKEKYPGAVFYIFTDDINWCRQNFIGEEYIFIQGNTPFEDMFLMSRCRHNIIANSTFSWWGAWLNNNSGKEIIVPAKWFKDRDINYDDLLPPGWIRFN